MGGGGAGEKSTPRIFFASGEFIAVIDTGNGDWRRAALPFSKKDVQLENDDPIDNSSLPKCSFFFRFNGEPMIVLLSDIL